MSNMATTGFVKIEPYLFLTILSKMYTPRLHYDILRVGHCRLNNYIISSSTALSFLCPSSVNVVEGLMLTSHFGYLLGQPIKLIIITK